TVVCSTPSLRAATEMRPARATARNTRRPSQSTRVFLHIVLCTNAYGGAGRRRASCCPTSAQEDAMATAIDIKDQQLAQWRDAADAWDRYFEWYSQAFAPVMTWCADAVAAAPGMRVLEVAAGSGQPPRAVAPRDRP